MATLDQIAKRLREQDNRATAYPLFVVQEEERVWGLDPEYADEMSTYVWRYTDDWEYVYESDEELIAEHSDSRLPERLAALSPWETEVEASNGARYEKIFYAKRWKFVCAHFTEAAAEEYIEHNRHNLKNPRVYVTSQHRCPEWIAVRDMLLARGEAAE